MRTLEKIAGLIGSRKQSIRGISAQFCYEAERHLLLWAQTFPLCSASVLSFLIKQEAGRLLSLLS